MEAQVTVLQFVLSGIGSSSISAAFDHSVAINLDGVVVNRGRFYSQLLYGYEAIRGSQRPTISILRQICDRWRNLNNDGNDPTDEFEFEVMAECRNRTSRDIWRNDISGALSENLLRVLRSDSLKNDEMWENLSVNDPRAAINGAERWYGDESIKRASPCFGRHPTTSRRS